MARFKIPGQPKLNIFNIKNFLGVDFTNADVDKRRSPDAYNIINNGGYPETRPGYDAISTIGVRINGVWNIDTANGDIFIVHSGNSIYECGADFKNPIKLIEGITDTVSAGIYLNGQLLIANGTRAIVYGRFGDNYEVKYLDEIGYVPTTIISRSPSGGGKQFEPVNMASKFRINSFLTTDTDYEYKLDVENLSNDEVIVQKMNADGNWETLKENTDFAVNRLEGKVIFNNIIISGPIEGRDNLTIRFGRINQEYLDIVNHCTIATTFGYDGNNNRIFISGNKDFPNTDWHSEVEDLTYFPDINYTKIGIEPIVNYLRMNDGRLAIQKKVSDTDCTIYYRTSALYNGQEVFPLTQGSKSLGCISKYANSNLLNDPLTLTEQGVFAVVSNNDEKFAMLRSHYINGKLLKESNLENAMAISLKGKYYLAINNNIYIADSRYKTYDRNSQTEQYQYEWYFWNNVPVRAWFSFNGELYFGTEEGKIVKFNETYMDYNKPTEVYWETPFLNLDSSTLAKTIKKIILTTRPNIASGFELGYITPKGVQKAVQKEYIASGFPRTLQEKERIKKIMFVKLYIKNNTDKKMSFEEINIEYFYSGKYKGE